VTRSAELSTGVAWRHLPERFEPWQTVWKRHHRFGTGGTWDMLLGVIQSEADAAGRVDWSVSVDSSIVRAHQHSATAKRVVREDRGRLEEHLGARSSDKHSRCCGAERGDHALGRSRGGLSTKLHAAVDGRGRPLVILLTPGQAGDAPMMQPLLAGVCVG
jgi:transposase